MPYGQITIILLTVGLIKKTQHKCFPEPKSFGRKVKFELYLSNYATKAGLKNAKSVDTSKFAKNG